MSKLILICVILGSCMILGSLSATTQRTTAQRTTRQDSVATCKSEGVSKTTNKLLISLKSK